jgi:hypothetical protein
MSVRRRPVEPAGNRTVAYALEVLRWNVDQAVFHGEYGVAEELREAEAFLERVYEEHFAARGPVCQAKGDGDHDDDCPFIPGGMPYPAPPEGGDR